MRMTADELELYVTNDGGSYHAYYLPVAKRLEKRWRKQDFDFTLACKAMLGPVTWAAHAFYREEHEFFSGQRWARLFPVALRAEVAERLVNHLLAEWRVGNSYLDGAIIPDGSVAVEAGSQSSADESILPKEALMSDTRGVTARFYVAEVTRKAYNPDHVEVTLKAAGRGEQNKAWAQYTPSGTLTMSINNPAAAKTFEDHLGQDFEVLFRPLDGEGRYVSEHASTPLAETA